MRRVSRSLLITRRPKFENKIVQVKIGIAEQVKFENVKIGIADLVKIGCAESPCGRLYHGPTCGKGHSLHEGQVNDERVTASTLAVPRPLANAHREKSEISSFPKPNFCHQVESQTKIAQTKIAPTLFQPRVSSAQGATEENQETQMSKQHWLWNCWLWESGCAKAGPKGKEEVRSKNLHKTPCWHGVVPNAFRALCCSAGAKRCHGMPRGLVSRK